MATPNSSNPIQPEKIEATQPIGPNAEETEMPARSFSSYMEETAKPPSASQLPSPFDVQQKALGVGGPGPTFDTLMSQTIQAGRTLGDISTQINTPNLKLKSSQKYLLKNKLTDATSLLRSANVTLGVDPGQPPDTANASGPLGKFLALVNDGTKQVDGAAAQLQQMSQSGASMNPADFLLVQVKLNKAQQELDFTSVLLGKAVDDLKQLMNIQV